MRKNIFVTIGISRGINRGTTFDFVLKKRANYCWTGFCKEFNQKVCYNRSTNVFSFEDGEIIKDCYVVAVTKE